MCKYCTNAIDEKENYIYDTLEPVKFGVNIQIDGKNMISSVYRYCEKINNTIGIAYCCEINYCPFCGKELSNELQLS